MWGVEAVFGGQGFGGFEGFDFGGGGFQNVKFDFGGGGGFGDIFESFFGGGMGGQQERSKKGPQRGSDIEMVISLKFEEAIFGATKEVEISRYETCDHCKGKGAEPGSDLKTCETCQGTGQQVRIQRTPLGQIQSATTCSECGGMGKIPEKKCKECKGEMRLLKNTTLKVKIPAGIHNQAVIRLKEKGEAGLQGGGYGDLFVHIDIKPHAEFERRQYDIYSKKTIHVLQAILGDEIKVNTVHGEADLKIPAGTQNGAVFKLKNYGVPKSTMDERGDHYVTISINVPEKLSRKEKELYEALAKESSLNIKPQSKGFFG